MKERTLALLSARHLDVALLPIKMTRKSAAPPGRTGGQTLVELLASVGIAGVLASAALPAFHGLVLDNRRAAAVNELVGALLLARTEAILRRQPVVVCGVRDADGNGQLDGAERTCAGHDWSAGWLVAGWVDADGDAVADAGELMVLRQHLADVGSGLRVIAGHFTATPPVAPSGSTVMKPFGQRSGNGTLTVCDGRGAGHARAVIISGSGRTRLSTRTAGGRPLTCP